MYDTKYMDEQFADEFKRLAEKSHFLNGKLEAKEYVDAIVLPFLNGRGGGLNNRREYIEESALHAEHIMESPYEVDKVSKINETAVYLGLFIKQWGHFLVDFVPRLWYLINNDSDLKLVYISIGNQEIDGVYAEFLNVFGIDTKRLTCIKDPTEFTKLIIPQTSYERPYRYYTEYKSIFDYMHSKIDKLNLSYQRYEKIYWTRTRLKKARKTETGEKVIEKLFEANGYKVLSPEKLSLKEQLFYFSTCKKMAGISGTIPHNLLFSDSNTEFVILNRTYRINVNQFPINELSGAKVVYIDCHASFFPNSADKGPYWMVFNEHLREFAEDMNFTVPKSVIKTEGHIRLRDLIKYIVVYFNTYTGKELCKTDAGMAGEISGISRPINEGTKPHELYYYYRRQFGEVPSFRIIQQHLKKEIKKLLGK